MSEQSADRPSIGFAVVASTFLALLVCFISSNLVGRHAHLSDVIAQQFNILRGQPLTFNGQPLDVWELHNRILVPVVLAGLCRLMTPESAFLVIRLATAWLMFLAFFMLMGGRRLQPALLGAGFLTYVLLISFAHDWEHPHSIFPT